MAQYQVMYWREIPAQVRASDAGGDVSVPMPQRFQEVIDEIAMREGLLDSDVYLESWHWGDPRELPGSAAEVAQRVVAELDTKYPKHLDDLMDYVRQIQGEG